nr:uncharacterized protein LOC116152911 [Camelus dromedarius]
MDWIASLHKRRNTSVRPQVCVSWSGRKRSVLTCSAGITVLPPDTLGEVLYSLLRELFLRFHLFLPPHTSRLLQCFSSHHFWPKLQTRLRRSSLRAAEAGRRVHANCHLISALINEAADHGDAPGARGANKPIPGGKTPDHPARGRADAPELDAGTRRRPGLRPPASPARASGGPPGPTWSNFPLEKTIVRAPGLPLNCAARGGGSWGRSEGCWRERNTKTREF